MKTELELTKAALDAAKRSLTLWKNWIEAVSRSNEDTIEKFNERLSILSKAKVESTYALETLSTLASFKASDQPENYADELADAHRRAGCAEQRLAWEKDSTAKREAWLDEAKAAWGVSRNISFDVIWEECLALKKASLVEKTDQPDSVAISRGLLAHTIDKVDDLARGYGPSRKEMAEAREIEIQLSELLDEHDTKLKSALNSK